jgi:hypothetical protein
MGLPHNLVPGALTSTDLFTQGLQVAPPLPLAPIGSPLLELPRITFQLTAGTQLPAWGLLLGKPNPRQILQ